jgi:hypothetical protein
MRTSIFALLACLLIACSEENPVEPAKPINVRLFAQYSISVIDHENVVFGVFVNVEYRADIDTVDIFLYQHRPPDENGFWHLPYSQSYLLKNTQATIDSLIIIGNPRP